MQFRVMRVGVATWWGCAAATTAVIALAITGAISALSQDEQLDYSSIRLRPVKNAEQVMSADETLGVIFNPQIGVSPRKYYARANPEAEDALYRVLNDGDLEEFHDGVWEILGYIGGEKHVPHIEKAIEKLKSTPRMLEPAERDKLQALFNSLGVMCGREIDAACELAEKMMDPAYWQNAMFRLNASPISIQHQAVSRLMIGYSLSLDPDIEKHTQSILKKIDDPKDREIWKQALDRKLLLGHGRNTRGNEEDPVTREERREMASFFNGDLENPGPALPRSSLRQR